jgi:hypothetical protein
VGNKKPGRKPGLTMETARPHDRAVLAEAKLLQSEESDMIERTI